MDICRPLEILSPLATGEPVKSGKYKCISGTLDFERPQSRVMCFYHLCNCGHLVSPVCVHNDPTVSRIMPQDLSS
jgi:hypothetical protein